MSHRVGKREHDLGGWLGQVSLGSMNLFVQQVVI